MPGVVVTATNEGNRQQREAVSNEDGYYVFPGLIVGTYTVSAELQGFSRSTTTGVRLNSAARISINIGAGSGRAQRQRRGIGRKDHTFDLRWDAFNVLHAPTLGTANNNPTSGSFGLVTSKTGNRTMQLVLQYRF